MRPSKYNIISRIHGSDDYFIVNSLSGNADMLTPGEMTALTDPGAKPDPEFIKKAYWSYPEEETKRFRKQYLDFIDDRDTDEIQIFYIPNYSCNFRCSYCYQSGYTNTRMKFDPEVVDRFFEHIQNSFAGRKYYITLFGGEPLLPGKNSRLFLSYFTDKCRERKIGLALVTNGYYLEEYLPLFSGIAIREIQVTLDGTEKIHNNRRPLKNGEGTFWKIVKGIDVALQQNLPVNLRMVTDRENIHELPELSRFAIERGWTVNPLFKTQIGRNYELHFCQSEKQKLYSRIGLYRDIHSLIFRYPEILEFHKPAFSLSRFLFEQGKLPAPLFDSCPGCKTEWAFDFTGRIYACTAAVGMPGEELGTFYPQTSLKEQDIANWQNRDILSIKECSGCNLALACGGGCAMLAKNKTGDLHSPDCRPVKELLELGIALYNEYDPVNSNPK